MVTALYVRMAVYVSIVRWVSIQQVSLSMIPVLNVSRDASNVRTVHCALNVEWTSTSTPMIV